MPRMVGRRFVIALALLALFPLHLLAQTSTFNLPAQPLADSLRALGAQTGLNIMVSPPLVDGKQAPALKADLTAKQALAALLQGTKLEYHFVNEQTVVIRERSSARDTTRDAGKATSQDIRAVEDPKVPTEPILTEVVVTAQKREERLMDVPVPVTVLTADNLLENNATRLQDYYNAVPGLSLISSGTGDNYLSIRGVTTGSGTNPTVAVLVDDVPYGSSTAFAGGASSATMPDIDPNDLARIEVLRGPQGTLYGASSIGGLLKLVTVDPSTEAVSGRLQATVNSVQNAANPGYGVRGSVNLPATDTLALRMSVFGRRDPGYIDDPGLGREGVNTVDLYGGRVSALWKPSNAWSVKVSGLFQTLKGDGYSSVSLNQGLADLQQSFAFPGAGHFRRDTQAYSATVKGDLGGLTLTSITGYNVNKIEQSLDYTPFFGPALGIPAVAGVTHYPTKKFSQEVRLANSPGGRIDWLVGAFYTHEDSKQDYLNVLSVDPGTATAVGSVYLDAFPTTYSEYAAFGDLTVHFTDTFDVQFGARESQNRQTYSESIAGPQVINLYGLPSPVTNPEIDTKDNSFTYLLSPRLRLTPDWMLYARFASGYRPGGPNPTSTLFNLPPTFKPDKTNNYELGTKAALLDGGLSIDASIYYIDWKDIQLVTGDPATGATFYTNASRARSDGVELAIQAHPVSGLTIGAWVTWADAVLRSDLPPHSLGVGFAGDRLPYSSKVSANLSVDESVEVSSGWKAVVGGSLSYSGDRESDFPFPGNTRFVLPSYELLNLHAGLQNAQWQVNLFANNVTNRRADLFYQSIPEVLANYVQPRTVGVSLVRQF